MSPADCPGHVFSIDYWTDLHRCEVCLTWLADLFGKEAA